MCMSRGKEAISIGGDEVCIGKKEAVSKGGDEGVYRKRGSLSR